MTKEELLERLKNVEWDDFEVKEASGGLPKSVWETVSAFSNTTGGVIVLGVKERKTEEGATYQLVGVANAEKMEQDFIATLRSRGRFNSIVSCRPMKFEIDGKTILAFEIPCLHKTCCNKELRKRLHPNWQRRPTRHRC